MLGIKIINQTCKLHLSLGDRHNYKQKNLALMLNQDKRTK